MNVRDVMTDQVDTATPGTNIADAAKMMRDLDIGFVPVSQQGELMGVITDRDITIRVTASGLDPFATSVGDYLSPNVVTVSPDTSTEEALSLMAENQIRRLLVVDGGKLVGVVSIGDLAIRSGEHDEDVAETLTEISEPTEDSPGIGKEQL